MTKAARHFAQALAPPTAMLTALAVVNDPACAAPPTPLLELSIIGKILSRVQPAADGLPVGRCSRAAPSARFQNADIAPLSSRPVADALTPRRLPGASVANSRLHVRVSLPESHSRRWRVTHPARPHDHGHQASRQSISTLCQNVAKLVTHFHRIS